MNIPAGARRRQRTGHAFPCVHRHLTKQERALPRTEAAGELIEPPRVWTLTALSFPVTVRDQLEGAGGRRASPLLCTLASFIAVMLRQHFQFLLL